ncbi:MFS transporter [Oceanobacter mangrovi]|uniref:MFS transporter n=1 Tax=Oceanobacter mangrovi TaxID=2862510 RepID=UPI001C8E2B65|nr:MFS transporter [Oceanobacter mangrovi]
MAISSTIDPGAAAAAPEPVSRFANWSRLGAATAICTTLMSSSLPSPLYAEYQQLWSLSSFWISVLFASYAMGVLISLLMTSRYGDKVSDRRYIIVSGCALILLGNGIMAFAPGPLLLFVGRVFAGIATGLMVSSASAALLELHPNKSARVAAVHATVSFTLGAALGPVISSVMLRLDAWPLHLSYLPVCITALIAALLVWLTPVPVLKTTAPEAAGADDVVAESDNHKPASTTSFWPMTLAILVLLQAWAIGSVFMASGTRFAIEIATVDGIVWAAALISIFQFLAAVGQVVGGRISQSRSIVVGVVISTLALIGAIMSAEGQFAMAFSVLICLSGFGYGLSFVGATALVNLSSGSHNRARLMSIYYIFGYVLGNAVPAMSVGAMIDAINLDWAYLVFGAWILLMTALLLGVAHMRRRDIFSFNIV